MPPNSFAEWVVGQNVRRKKKKKNGPTPVVAFDLSTDHESDTDIIKLAVPRRRVQPIQDPEEGKKVRFKKVPSHEPPLKASSEEVATSGSEVSTGDESDSEEQARKGEIAVDAPYDYLESVRRMLSDIEQAEQSEEETSAALEFDKKTAAKSRKVSKPDKEKAKITSKKGKRRSGRHRRTRYLYSSDSTTSSEDTESEISDSESEEERRHRRSKRRDRKSKGKREKKKTKHSNKGDSAKAKEDNGASGGSKTSDKKSDQPKLAPEVRKASLLMPVAAQTLHVEHAVETIEDPRPNAFYDNQHGIMRVYHGPAYGNSAASLYPRRPDGGLPLPFGAPHPTQNPYFYGFPTAQGMPPFSAPPMQAAGQDPKSWFQGNGQVTVGAPPTGNPKYTDPNNPFRAAGASPTLKPRNLQNPDYNPWGINQVSPNDSIRDIWGSIQSAVDNSPSRRPRETRQDKRWDRNDAPGGAYTTKDSRNLEEFLIHHRNGGSNRGSPGKDRNKDSPRKDDRERGSPSRNNGGAQASGGNDWANNGWTGNNDHDWNQQDSNSNKGGARNSPSKSQNDNDHWASNNVDQGPSKTPTWEEPSNNVGADKPADGSEHRSNGSYRSQRQDSHPAPPGAFPASDGQPYGGGGAAWGDTTAAQSTGGFWDKKDAEEDWAGAAAQASAW